MKQINCLILLIYKYILALVFIAILDKKVEQVEFAINELLQIQIWKQTTSRHLVCSWNIPCNTIACTS